MVPRIDIGMKPSRELPESSFDVIHRRSSADLKNDVEIVFTGHGLRPPERGELLEIASSDISASGDLNCRNVG
jgi:hypothetical protein